MNLSTSPQSNTGFERIRRQTAQILTLIVSIHLVFIGVLNALEAPEARLTTLTATFAFALVYITCFILAQSNRVAIASSLLVFAMLMEIVLGGLFTLSAAIILVVVIATLISSIPLFYLYNILTIAAVTYTVLGGGVAAGTSGATTLLIGGTSLIEESALLIALLGVTITVRYFRSNIQQSAENAEKNADLLRISAEVGQITAGITSQDELLPQAVDFIRERFGYYHVQIFLLNETGDVAELKASTGEVGQKLLARQHRLNVGSDSVIGRVTQTGQYLNYEDTGARGVHYRNELLPNTRSELALPIRDGERIIGALDVQSTEPRAFEQTQIRSLQIMTNLLAASIRNAALFEEQQRNIQENQRLYIETQANLREIQRLNRQLTKQSWEQFTAELGDSSGVTLEGNQLSREAPWTQLLQQASRTRQPVTDDAGTYALAVPIILRGEVIGALEIEPDETLDEDDTIQIVRAVSERLAVSLDNARLYEESQETTLFEQRINQIVGQYQGATSVDELLQITIDELSQTLGAKRGAIRLSSDDTEFDTTNNGSNGTGQT